MICVLLSDSVSEVLEGLYPTGPLGGLGFWWCLAWPLPCAFARRRYEMWVFPSFVVVWAPVIGRPRSFTRPICPGPLGNWGTLCFDPSQLQRIPLDLNLWLIWLAAGSSYALPSQFERQILQDFTQSLETSCLNSPQVPPTDAATEK